MKIQVVSDLHLEFSDTEIYNAQNSDVLILSGDILVAEKLKAAQSTRNLRFRDFFARMSARFPHVIYIAGNHEFYSGKFFNTVNRLREFCASEFSNVYFLERDTKIIDDVVFLGGTLWTDMNKRDPLTLHAVTGLMNDYRVIRNDQASYRALNPTDTVNRHRLTLEYFYHVLSENKDKRCVVVSHHSPSFLSCAREFAGDYLMNGAYHSDLSEFILDRPQIKLWTHGHTHRAFDYTLGETRVVCNPRGYNDYEDTGYNPELVIELL